DDEWVAFGRDGSGEAFSVRGRGSEPLRLTGDARGGRASFVVPPDRVVEDPRLPLAGPWTPRPARGGFAMFVPSRVLAPGSGTVRVRRAAGHRIPYVRRSRHFADRLVADAEVELEAGAVAGPFPPGSLR